QGIADMRNLILSLSSQYKKTVIVSSHLLSEIEQIASRILIIDKGKKLVEGSSDELFDQSKIIIELNTNDNKSAYNILSESNWSNKLQPIRNGQIILQINKNDIPIFNQYLVSKDIAVFSLQPRHSLEDYFLQITAGKQHVEAFRN
ncbi:MAG: ABC transporter ATP-binding protein, partial [Sediminibacterium sp.]